jgi:O-antigen ligase
MGVVLVLYFLFFSLLAWRRFSAAIALFIILLPTYLVRFELVRIGKYPFPSTMLEVMFGVILLIWIIRYSRTDVVRIKSFFAQHMWFAVVFGLFFASSVVSIFVSDMVFFSLGEWRAYFLEPMILFLILIGRREIFMSADLPLFLTFSTLSISMYAIIQKFTGIGIATPEWTNEATRRVTAFFTSPNAVGLYMVPICMLMAALVLREIRQAVIKGEQVKRLFFKPVFASSLFGVLCAMTALFFTKSQGAWIGMGAGLLVFVFLIGYKKIAVALTVIGMVFALLVPSMRQAVLFQDQANQNRLRLWGYSWTFLTDSPKNFVLGTGVRQFFRKIQKPYYDVRVMERLIYPHNIFLNFWTEIGLVGMLVVLIIISQAAVLAWRIRQNDMVLGAGFIAMLAALVVHGLVDVPYFKNDLAFLFWILIASIFIAYAHTNKSKA